MTDTIVRAPVGRVPGDVTRYLSAAAYLDERFTNRVVDEVLADEVSAIAPSIGVDLATVANHCLAAREMRYVRDLPIAAAAGIVALFGPLWLVFGVILLCFSGIRRTDKYQSRRGVRQATIESVVSTAGRLGTLVVIAFIVGATLSLLPMNGLVQWLFGAYLYGIPAVLAFIAAALFSYQRVMDHEFRVDQLLRSSMGRETYSNQILPVNRKKFFPWIEARLAAIKEAQGGNVTIYSGYTPFIGFAQATSAWSIAVPLLPAKDGIDARPRSGKAEEFTVEQLIQHVREQLHTLIAPSGPNAESNGHRSEFASLVIEDRVFVNGAGIGNDARFMGNSNGLHIPSSYLSPSVVSGIKRHPTGTARHCLAIHVPLWGGDVVPSVFLHFSTAGKTLHLKCENHILGPVDAKYHIVDHMREELTPERRRWLRMTALDRLAHVAVHAPLHVLRYVRYNTRHTERMRYEKEAIEQDPMFDYGARLSIRELALSPRYHNYFQVVDAGRIVSAVERHSLATIREFLDERGFDITDFRSQQQTILNQGIIQQGGLSLVGNQAVGAGSQATQNVASNPEPK